MMSAGFIRSVNFSMKSEMETQRKKTEILNGQKAWDGQIKCLGLKTCSENINTFQLTQVNEYATEPKECMKESFRQQKGKDSFSDGLIMLNRRRRKDAVT